MAEALVICRFIHFTAAMLLFGVSTFCGLLSPPELRAGYAGLLRIALPILVLLLAATAVIWLGLEAGNAGAGWADAVSADTVGSVLFDTAFGQVWQWRLVLMVLLAAALLPRMPSRLAIVALLSAAALGSLGLVGHAAMEDGTWGWIHRGNQVVHLLAAGFWLGCLPPLLVSLSRLRDPGSRRDAATALRRFSGLGHFAVALVIATGVVNTALILGKPPVDFTSPYQLLLAAKIGLVALMLSIALVNRYVAVPRLTQGKAPALRLIAAGTIGEIVVGALVLALVSAFATFDPV